MVYNLLILYKLDYIYSLQNWEQNILRQYMQMAKTDYKNQSRPIIKWFGFDSISLFEWFGLDWKTRNWIEVGLVEHL